MKMDKISFELNSANIFLSIKKELNLLGLMFSTGSFLFYLSHSK